MKQWLAILAAVAFLTLPAMVSADDETVIPPEANWSATPGTPEVVAVTQPRVVSTAPEQTIETGAASHSALSFSFNEQDARYRAANETAKEE
jgi:hypothetical protein